MKVVRSPSAMQKIADAIHRKGKTIGFVPTMGYLHEGHLSLVRIARKKSDYVVVSIFVNPTQFGPKEDFARYPRNFARDKQLLIKEKVDYIFYPSIKSMYEKGYKTYVEVRDFSDVLCGRSRPGHFQGVATVVAKLFNIVKPDIAVFGQKDAQQAIIIRQMTKDLNFPIKIIVAPTIREKDGLAMSSRNSYLTPKQRIQAPILYQALQLAKKLVAGGEKSSQKIITAMQEMISQMPDANIDYIAVVNTKTLRPVKKIIGETLIALAVKFGKARLIDNIIIK
ncbi:MAG: pantoate--beta-alanine ligase [candidate division WOR-3 bacterium]|nr:pantoate--beta-alanine ligase [candidate division WOR-3 bacterium]